MAPEADIGLLLIGTGRRAAHLAALDRLDGVRVVSAADGDAVQAPQGAAGLDPVNQLLADPQVHAAVVCTPLREREYWVTQAARAGKHVFCESPATTSFLRTRRLVQLCAESSVALTFAAEVLFGELASHVRQVLDGRQVGPLLFVDLAVSVPQHRLRGTREGVLLGYGIPCLSLLGSRFGAIDSIYARTRSLGLNRPEEDLAVAQFRYQDGLEGVFQLNGLGAEAQVCLRVYGQQGAAACAVPLEEDGGPGLRRQYADFAAALRLGRDPSYNGVQVLEGMRCLEWVQQAARLDREVFRNEVTFD